MKAYGFLLLVVGLVLLLVGVPLGIVSLVAAFDGLSENSPTFWLSLIFSVVSLFLSALCFRLRRNLLFRYFKKIYSGVVRVVISNENSRFSAITMPLDTLSVTGGRVKKTLSMIIHFKDGSVSTRRVRPNSIEYRCLAPFIHA